MNHNFSIFFVGLAIITLFGFRALVFLAIIYFLYKYFSENKKKSFSWEKVVQNIFDKSSVEEAKVASAKNNISSFFNTSFMNSKSIITGLVVAFVIALIIDGFVMVQAGHVAVILDRGRGVLEETLPTGLHVKIPFWQKATIMDVRLQTYTMSIANAEGAQYGNDAIQALTKDGQEVNVDVTVQFYLSAEKAAKIYNEVGLNYLDKIVRPAARSVVRNVITGFNSKELFQNETRLKVQEMMKEGVLSNLENKDIVLDDVLLRNVQFSQIYLKAIEDKQVAEQQIQKAEFEKQKALIQKEKKIIEAEADAEAIHLKGQALNKNPKIIEFEMVQKLSPNIEWGVLPDNVLPMLNLGGVKK